MTGWRLLVACAACGCASREATFLPPHVNVSPEAVDLADDARVAGGASVGLEVAANESDTLEGLARFPGVRVVRVELGAAAAAASIAPGDVILSAGGVEVNDGDAWETVLRRVRAGEKLRLDVRRDTLVFAAEVSPVAAPEGARPRELYRADPLRSRAGFETVVTASGEARTAARVVKVFAESPLPGAGIAAGDEIVAVAGRPLASAQDLVRRLLEEHGPGDAVRFGVVRGGREEEVDVRLWAAPRRLTRLAAYPLFSYEAAPRGERWRLKFIDLWVFSLISIGRQGVETDGSFLGLIRWGSGAGELDDVPEAQP